MNKKTEPGKTLWNLPDGVGYLWVALTAQSKRTRQTAWVLVKEFWLWPLIFVSLLEIFWHAFFHFVVGW